MRAESRSWFAAAAWLVLAACRNGSAEPHGAAPKAASPLSSSEKSAVLEVPPGRAGEWVEAQRYRLRVLDAFPCDEAEGTPSDTPAATDEPDTRPPSATTPGKPGHYRLGVAIEIEANDRVFATARAAVLEKNGKQFTGIVDPRPSAACRALFTPRSLSSAERASGIIVFEAPAAEYLTGATLKFRPPRWGFETTTGVVLPSCFGSRCPETKPKAEAKL